LCKSDCHFLSLLVAFWPLLVAFGRFWLLLVASSRFLSFWSLLVAFWSLLVASSRFLVASSRFWSLFGRFWSLLGRFWSPFRVDVAFTQEGGALLNLLIELSDQDQARCKKSSFGSPASAIELIPGLTN